jgi:hypothetical protein
MENREARKEVARKRLLKIERLEVYYKNFNESKAENVEDWIFNNFRKTYFYHLRNYERRYYFRLLKFLKPDWYGYNHFIENSTNEYAIRCWREDSRNER